MDRGHIQPLFRLHPHEVSLPINNLISRIIFSPLIVIQLLCQMVKKEKACTPLLNPPKILVNIVCQDGLDHSLPLLEELVEFVTALFMLHIKLVFTIRSNVDF